MKTKVKTFNTVLPLFGNKTDYTLVEPLGEPLDKKPTHIYKAVPKVF